MTITAANEIFKYDLRASVLEMVSGGEVDINIHDARNIRPAEPRDDDTSKVIPAEKQHTSARFIVPNKHNTKGTITKSYSLRSSNNQRHQERRCGWQNIDGGK